MEKYPRDRLKLVKWERGTRIEVVKILLIEELEYRTGSDVYIYIHRGFEKLLTLTCIYEQDLSQL